MKDYELWMPLADIDERLKYYEVSNHGRLRSIPHVIFYKKKGVVASRRVFGKILKLTSDKAGYLRLNVSGIRKCFKAHRLVAFAFIPVVEWKKHVNHKDGNPANNYYENLEWCTRRENALHSFRVLGRKSPVGMKGMVGMRSNGWKPVGEFNSDGYVIRTWQSARLAFKELNISRDLFYRTCAGNKKSAKGRYFKYLNKEEYLNGKFIAV